MFHRHQHQHAHTRHDWQTQTTRRAFTPTRHGLSASHLFNLSMGKVVGSNGYRIACRHEVSAYTIFWGAPLIFCTPSIAGNWTFAILITQDRSVSLEKDADIDLAIR